MAAAADANEPVCRLRASTALVSASRTYRYRLPSHLVGFYSTFTRSSLTHVEAHVSNFGV